VIGLILLGQNHLYVKMLFYKGFRYSEVFQKILQLEKSVPCQPSGRPYHPFRTPDKPSIIRPDDVYFCSDPSLYREASVPACIRSDDSAASGRPSVLDQASNSFQKLYMGRLLKPSGRRGFLSRHASPQGKNRNSNSTVRTLVCHHPDTRASDMEIVDLTSTVRTPAYHGPDVSTTDMEIAC
jgi:hypothetical protein